MQDLVTKAEAMDLPIIERELGEALDRLERLRWQASDAAGAIPAGVSREIRNAQAWLALLSDRFRDLSSRG